MSMPHYAKGLGPELTSMSLMAHVVWGHAFDICHIFLRRLPHHFSSWASNILASGPCAPEIVCQNGFHIPPRAIQLTHTRLLSGLGTEDRDL